MKLCKSEAEHFSFTFHKIKNLLHISESTAPDPEFSIKDQCGSPYFIKSLTGNPLLYYIISIPGG